MNAFPIKDYCGRVNNDSDCVLAVWCCYPIRVTTRVDAGSVDPEYSNQVPYSVFVVLVEATAHPAQRPHSMRPFGCDCLLDQGLTEVQAEGILILVFTVLKINGGNRRQSRSF
jgi:hypothetical protein